MKREDKIKALETEYHALVADREHCQGRIRNEWSTASVQDMRDWEGRIFKASGRIEEISKTEAFLSFKDKARSIK